MKVFLSSGGGAGKVSAMSVPGSIPAVIKLEGMADSDTVMITGMGIEQNSNVQFMETLRDRIYIYAFGEHMGDIEIQGMAFWAACSGSSKPGLLSALDFYATNRVSRTEQRVRVVLGGSRTLYGFLRGVRGRVTDAEKGFSNFSFRISTLPLAKQ